MKRPLMYTLLIALVTTVLAGCGGGGGGSGSGGGGGDGGGGGGAGIPVVATPAKISGVARKGLIRYAQVNAYKMLATTGGPDKSGSPLASAITDNRGNFSLDIPPGNDLVIIEITGRDTGTPDAPPSDYLDETDPAGTRTIRFTSSDTLETIVVVNDSSAQNVAVTPFTDITADLLRSFFTLPTPPKDTRTAYIAALNIAKGIALKLGVTDITNPNDPGYANALTLFTQYMLDRTAAGAQPNAELAAEAFFTAIVSGDPTSLNAALTAAVASLAAKGITVPAPTPFVPITMPDFSTTATLSSPAVVTLRTEGALPSGSLIGAIDITLNLPPGVTVKASPSPTNPEVLVPDAGVVVLQGEAAAASGVQMLATYVKGATDKVVIKIISPNGLSAGDFATVNCDVSGASAPLPTDFSVTANKASTSGVSDVTTAALSAVGVKFSAVGIGLGVIPQGTTGVVTLGAAGTLPSGSLIGAIDVTLNLPAGVTVLASTSSINSTILTPDAGVVVPQGAATGSGNQLQTTYVRGTPNKLIIQLISANGLAIGDFARVTYVVTSGSAPLPAAFSITSNNVSSTTGVFDLSTAALSGISIMAK